MSPTDPVEPPLDRAARLRRVIEAVVARRTAGEQLPDDAVVAANPELLPELEAELDELRKVDEARVLAESTTSLGMGDVLRDAARLAGVGVPDPGSFAGFAILGEIHRGGQGVVYQALQKSTGRKVAIKVMREGPFADAAERARFEREVRVLGQLKHPNIVAIHDTGVAGGWHYFVMDYIAGQPLDVYVAGAGEHGPLTHAAGGARDKAERKSASRPGLSIESTLSLFATICEAVNAAHVRGIIHRDLKPGNIRVDEHGEPHILDFGLAKFTVGLAAQGEAEGAPAMTVTGQFLGSLPWAAPEQAEGAPSKIDTRTDVYSLGVILYQMLTGRFPYEVVGNMRDVLDRILAAAPARPSIVRRQINNEVETIVLKCLAKERERRYQSAGDLAEEIHRYLRGEAILAKRDSAWYVLRKLARRNALASAALASVLVVLISATAVSVAFYGEKSAASRDQASSDALALRQAQQIVALTGDQLLPAFQQMALGWFLLEWHAGRAERARAIAPLAAAGTPTRQAMEFLLDGAMPFERLRAALPERELALAHFVNGERESRAGRVAEAAQAFEACISSPGHGWLKAAARVRLDELRRAAGANVNLGARAP